MDFLVKSEKQPWILQNDGSITRLPSEKRAHEMPDIVLNWIWSLKIITADPYSLIMLLIH